MNRPGVPARVPFTAAERALVGRLDTPPRVQRWLRSLPYNWELSGPTARTFRGVVRTGTAHCLEAALCAAAVLESHGHDPLLLDITSRDRLDHVVFPFRQGGRWGAVARSRCAGLEGRKPAFRDLDALVRSYMAPFIDTTGRVTGYGLLDLRSLPTGRWRLHPGNVWHVEAALNTHRHRRLPTPEGLYRRERRRFDAWHAAQGFPEHAWPTAYPGRDKWL